MHAAQPRAKAGILHPGTMPPEAILCYLRAATVSPAKVWHSPLCMLPPTSAYMHVYTYMHTHEQTALAHTDKEQVVSVAYQCLFFIYINFRLGKKSSWWIQKRLRSSRGSGDIKEQAHYLMRYDDI